MAAGHKFSNFLFKNDRLERTKKVFADNGVLVRTSSDLWYCFTYSSFCAGMRNNSSLLLTSVWQNLCVSRILILLGRVLWSLQRHSLLHHCNLLLSGYLFQFGFSYPPLTSVLHEFAATWGIREGLLKKIKTAFNATFSLSRLNAALKTFVMFLFTSWASSEDECKNRMYKFKNYIERVY